MERRVALGSAGYRAFGGLAISVLRKVLPMAVSARVSGRHEQNAQTAAVALCMEDIGDLLHNGIARLRKGASCVMS
jgi:hypothetical protein